MRLLGALIAGGAARRFGSDKAQALLAGRALWRHVADALGPQVEALVVCGRTLPGLATLADRPTAGLGPLGGIAAALHHAGTHRFDGVVSVPVDTPRLPADLIRRLVGATAAYAIDCPVIGWWPTALAPVLDTHIAADPKRALRGWTDAIGARGIDFGPIANVNRPDELTRLA